MVPDFAITTSQCLVVSTEYVEVPGKDDKTPKAPRDTVERAIRVTVTSNTLFDEWVELQKNLDAEAIATAHRLATKGPLPRGRKPNPDKPPRPKPLVTVGPNGELVKRGRGRPKRADAE